MAVNGFERSEHLAENREGLREEIEGREAPNEGVVEESGLAVCEGKYVGGFEHLGASGVGRDKLGSYEVMVGNSGSYESGM